MRLLPHHVRASLLPLGSQRRSEDPVVYAKFVIPDVGWTWYVTEGQAIGNDFLFFGYVVGRDEEWEHFSLDDLETVRSPNGQHVIHEVNFTPAAWSEINAARTREE